jgi:hypothetical protein
MRVQAKQCETCIYGPNNRLDLKKLENDIRDPRMKGHFVGFRICHHSSDVCCRGFWDRHKDHFDAGQIAQRLNIVQFVNIDTLNGKRR